MDINDSGILVQWEVIVPSEPVFCSVSFVDNKDAILDIEGIEGKLFKLTHIIEARNHPDQFFDCAGDIKGVKSTRVKLPANLDVKNNLLRFIWITEKNKGQTFVEFEYPRQANNSKGPFSRGRLLEAEDNTKQDNTQPKAQGSSNMLTYILIPLGLLVVAGIIWMVSAGKKTAAEEPVRERAKPRKQREPKVEQPKNQPQENSKRSKKRARKAKTNIEKKEVEEEQSEEEVVNIEDKKDQQEKIEEYVDPLRKKHHKHAKKYKRGNTEGADKAEVKQEEEPIIERATARKPEIKQEMKAEKTKKTKKKGADKTKQAEEELKKTEQIKAEAEKKEEEDRKVKEKLEKEKAKAKEEAEKQAEAKKQKEEEERKLQDQEQKAKEVKKPETKGKKKKGKKTTDKEENKDVAPKSEEPLVEYRLPPKKQAKQSQPVEQEIVNEKVTLERDDEPLVVEEATAGLKYQVEELETTGLKHEIKPGVLYETAPHPEEKPQDLPKINPGNKPKPKPQIKKEKAPEQRAPVIPEEKPQELPKIAVNEKVKPMDKAKAEIKPEIKSKVAAKKVAEEKPQNAPEVILNDKVTSKNAVNPEVKPKVEREIKKINIDTAGIEKSGAEEEDKDASASPCGSESVRSPVGDLALSPTLSSDGADFGTSSEILGSSSGGNLFTTTLENALLPSVKKITAVNQDAILTPFKTIGPNGKATWTKTHFIFTIDCSERMAGARWDSVTLGYEACLHKLMPFKDIVVSAFTYDGKVNPYCREKAPAKAVSTAKDIPYTGKGCNFRRAIDYVIRLIERSAHKDYLACVIFLAGGLTGPTGIPKEQTIKLKTMQKAGLKLVMYCLSCEAEEEADIKNLADSMEGEYYKLEKAEASRVAFYHVLDL